MMRARVSGEGFQEFSAEGETVEEVLQDAINRLTPEEPLDFVKMQDFTLSWIPEHEPRLDDDVHRWLLAWRDTAKVRQTTTDAILQEMAREYVTCAREGKVLRP